MNININAIIQFIDIEGNMHYERVLWKDRNNSEIVTIDINSRSALPTSRKQEELSVEIEKGNSRIYENDPYQYLVMPEETLSDNEKEKRDKACQIIEPLLKTHQIDILFPSTRGKIISKYIALHKFAKSTVYKYLRRFWQRGQTPNALLSDYFKCGGRGKSKTITNKRLGRHSANNQQETTPFVWDETKKKGVMQSISRHYGSKSGKCKRFKDAYNWAMKENYAVDTRWDGDKIVPILPPSNRRPTLRQVKREFEKTRGITERLILSGGEKEYNLKRRPILGESAKKSEIRPGMIWQMDAAVLNVVLVNPLDRSRRIGKPVLYLLVDVFSRLIVGFYISLRNMSWASAMVAICNAIGKKPEFCKKYGVDITEEDWPIHFAPESILIDRGETAGNKADMLSKALDIEIINTAPYRPDEKGIIESYFNVIKNGFMSNLPGATKKKMERGDPDSRLDACLTLDMIRKIFIGYILYHNNEKVLENYDPKLELISEKVPLIPIEIWNWGINNLPVDLREIPSDEVRIGLMPREKASITEKGILFKGLHYDCDTANYKELYTDARKRGWKKTLVAYDPDATVEHIYIPKSRGEKYEVCTLLEKDSQYHTLYWEEVEDLQAARKEGEQLSRDKSLQHYVTFLADTEGIVKIAKREAKSANIGLNKSTKLNGIRQNRKEARRLDRENNSLEEGQAIDPHLPSKSTDIKLSNEYIPPPSYTDELLRQLLERKDENT